MENPTGRLAVAAEEVDFHDCRSRGFRLEGLSAMCQWHILYVKSLKYAVRALIADRLSERVAVTAILLIQLLDWLTMTCDNPPHAGTGASLCSGLPLPLCFGEPLCFGGALCFGLPKLGQSVSK